MFGDIVITTYTKAFVVQSFFVQDCCEIADVIARTPSTPAAVALQDGKIEDKLHRQDWHQTKNNAVIGYIAITTHTKELAAEPT